MRAPAVSVAAAQERAAARFCALCGLEQRKGAVAAVAAHGSC